MKSKVGRRKNGFDFMHNDIVQSAILISSLYISENKKLWFIHKIFNFYRCLKEKGNEM